MIKIGFLKRRATKLLFMPYTLIELADELETDPEVISQALNEGCKSSIDEENTWILGPDFQEWIGVLPAVVHPKYQVLRDNWADIKTYLAYNTRVLQLDRQTVKRKRAHLRHFLEWSGSAPLPESPRTDPPFPAYLVNARNDQHSGRLSSETLDAGCEEVRRFLFWAKNELPDRYGQISKTWIDALRPSRANGRQSELKTHEFYSLNDILLFTSVEPRDLTEKRDIAAICFLYLSGMRVDAFVTLPIECIDLRKNEIMQLPAMGVRTKNRKAAVTHLLQIPPLLSKVDEWDKIVKSELQPNMLWYAYLDSGKRITGSEKAGEDRRSLVAKGLKKLCERTEIKYRSPHKLRHGNAVYGIKNARDIRELKAISQNLMHSSITITDGIYGNLTTDDVNQTISSLGSPQQKQTSADDLNVMIQVFAKLQENPALIQKILDA